MATASPSEDDNQERATSNSRQYVCPVCLKSAKTPRLLPCLHTFCEGCLHTLITAAVAKVPGDVACPVCRKKIVAPESGLLPEKWAKSFTLNYCLSESLLAPDAKDTTFEKEICRFCERSNKQVQAEHYCKNCSEAICEACKNMHKIVPVLKNHNIWILEYFQRHPSIPDKDEMCQNHQSKVVEVFCLDHIKMCCSVCFLTQHRYCKDVKSIEECAELLSEDVFEDMISKLESLLNSIEGEIEGKEKLGVKLMKCKEMAVLKTRQCVEAAKKNLDILLHKSESEIDDQYSSDDSRLRSILKILQGIKTSVVGDRQMLETANKYGSRTQVFVILEKAKIQICEQLRQILDAESDSLTEDYTVNFKIVDDIGRLKRIGSIRSIMSSCPVVAQATIDRLSAFKSCGVLNVLNGKRLLDIEPQKIKSLEKWTYQLPDTCYGATFLGRKIAVITKMKEIVVLMGDGRVIFRHNIPYSGEPADINNTGDENKVFISFRMETILKEYYVDDKKMTELGKISLQGIAEGFWTFDDRIVHASKDCIFISSRNGQLRQSIPSKSQGSIAFLTGCPKQRMFYYTDGENMCFRKLDEDTVTKVPLSLYTSNPRGIGIDYQGNICACCFDSLFQCR